MAKKPVRIADPARSKAAGNRKLKAMLDAGSDPMTIAATAISDLDVRDRAGNSIKASVARTASEHRLRSMLDAGADPMAIAAAAISDMDVRDRARDDEALPPPASGTQDFKVLVVLDCYRQDDFSIQEVKENAPDFIDAVLCRDYLPDGSPYRFSNPCLYVDIKDFDLDRLEHLDHFALEVANRWIHSPQPAHPSAATAPPPDASTPSSSASASPHHCKTILLLDCERAGDFSIQDVFENAPSFIDYKLGNATGRQPLAESAPAPYHFVNACLYVDLDDFDLDRAERLDHFAPEIAHYWLNASPVLSSEEPAIN